MDGALDLGTSLGISKESGDLAHMSRQGPESASETGTMPKRKVSASGAEGRLTLLVLRVLATFEGHLRGWGGSPRA